MRLDPARAARSRLRRHPRSPGLLARSLVVSAGVALAAYGAAATPRPKPGRCLEARYEGVVDLEAHFERPGATRRYQSRQIFLTDGRGRTRLDWWTWSPGDSIGLPETMLITSDSVFHRAEPSRAWASLR